MNAWMTISRFLGDRKDRIIEILRTTRLDNYFNMLIEVKINIKSDPNISAASGDTGGEWTKLWWDVITCGVWAYDNDFGLSDTSPHISQESHSPLLPYQRWRCPCFLHLHKAHGHCMQYIQCICENRMYFHFGSFHKNLIFESRSECCTLRLKVVPKYFTICQMTNQFLYSVSATWKIWGRKLAVITADQHLIQEVCWCTNPTVINSSTAPLCGPTCTTSSGFMQLQHFFKKGAKTCY